MKKILLRCFLLFSPLFFAGLPLYPLNAAGGHRGNITALIHKEDVVISCGDDGFMVTWSISERTAVERFQLTTNKIQAMISNPQRSEICVIESSGPNSFWISAWNYSRKEKLFSIYSTEPVTFINYSAGGSFIIASGLNGFPLAILDSSTGDVISEPVIPTGAVVFGITGRAERNMMIYQADHEDHTEHPDFGGRILYLDLDSFSVTGNFQTASNLTSPVIFGSNRFLAGVNHDGLQLIDAASGALLDSMENIERSALLCPSSDGFYCLNRRRDGSLVLYSFSADRNGKLVVRQQLPLSFDANVPVSAIAYNGSMVFASAQGGLFLLGQQNRITPFTFNFQTRITEIAAGERNIAVLTENGGLFFLPIDYRLLGNSSPLTVSGKNGYNRINRLIISGEDYFLLWQTANARLAPQLLSANQPSGNNLNFLLGRFPLRAISSFNNRLLALDTGGNLTVRGMEGLTSANPSAETVFTFSSVGAIDAAFINNENIIICRSAINNNSPFLSVNIRTGETVPYLFTAQAGLTVYPGRSGIYAAAVEQDSGGRLKTTFINFSNSSVRRVFEYPAEAVHLSIAESLGRFAAACDSEGAKIYGDKILNFERTAGLPVKLLAAGIGFICLDSEGNIAWHDNTGKLLAVFSLHDGAWTLSTGTEITGEINRP